jgi:hypothetical protein
VLRYWSVINIQIQAEKTEKYDQSTKGASTP